MVNKKSQVTIFIIIGIIILVSLASVLYIRTKVTKKPSEIPPEVRKDPIDEYVGRCLYDVSKDALNIIGMQGGYINIPDQIRLDPLSSLALDPLRYFTIPYWYNPNKNAIPSLNFIENQISDYIKDNIDSCINNFEPFKNEFDIKKIGNTTAKTKIMNGTIRVELNYPIQITYKSNISTSTKTKFVEDLNINFKKIYDLAVDITNADTTQLWLEKFTIYLMTSNPKIPFTGFKLSCSQNLWKVSDVKNAIKSDLHTFLPYVRFRNTKHIPFMARPRAYDRFKGVTAEDIANKNLPRGKPPSDSFEYFRFFWNFTNNNYNNIIVSLDYQPQWGLYFNAKPSESGYLRSSLTKSTTIPGVLSKVFCINYYHFTYDIISPIKVTIRDDSAFNNEGYTFNFAIPIIISNNYGNKVTFPIEPTYSVETTSSEMCGSLTEKKRMIKVYDYIKGVPTIANISYDCLGHVCNLGSTGLSGGDILLETGLPRACRGGMIIAQKQGYISDEKQDMGQDEIELNILPTKTFEYAVYKHPKNNLDEKYPLSNDETVFITAKIKDRDHSFYSAYPDNNTITLVNGPIDYKLTIFMVKNGNITGGYIGNWTEDDTLNIEDSNKIIFNVIDFGVPQNPDEVYNMTTYLYTNTTYKQKLKPELE